MSHPVVTVAIGPHEVLRFDGERAAVHVVGIAHRTGVAEALARALATFLAHQATTPLAGAVDAIERLAALPDPGPAAEAVARITEAVAAYGRADAASVVQ